MSSIVPTQIIHLRHSSKKKTCCGLRFIPPKSLVTENIQKVTCFKCLSSREYKLKIINSGQRRKINTEEFLQLRHPSIKVNEDIRAILRSGDLD